MTPTIPFGRALFAPCALFLAVAGRAADKIDLDRDVPVPANEQIPVADFFRQPMFRSPVVNPIGTDVAAIVASGVDNSALVTVNLDTDKLDALGTRDIDSDVNWINWLGDDRVGFIITEHKSGGLLFGSARVGQLQATAHPIMQGVGGWVVAVPPSDRQHPLVGLFRGGYLTGRYGQVVAVNAALESGRLLDLGSLNGQNLNDAQENTLRHVTKRYPVLETPEGFDLGYFGDKDGKLAFATSSTGGVLKLHQLVDDHWQDCPEDLDETDLIGCGDNPGEVVVVGPRKDNKPRPLVVLDAATGQTKEVLVEDKAYDPSGWLYRDPVSHNIVGVVYDRTGPNVRWFSKGYLQLQKMVDGLFPGQIVRIIGNDEKGKMLLLQTWSDRQPDFYRWVNLDKMKVRDLHQSMPWLDPKRMMPMSSFKYETLDGRHLDAYVVMPAGATKANPPPLVVIASGGRHAWGFNPLAQFFASRGYAVLLPNHRASPGTSWMFPASDEWAYRKIHGDVTQATKTIAASGLVDPHRIAIMGTDFGGYLALSGGAYEPNLYRCVISISGVGDWARMFDDEKINKFEDAYFTRVTYKLGSTKQDPEKWDAIAPLRHAGDIRAAVFISTSEYDNPAAIGQQKEIASIAEHNHLPVETVSFINESIGVRHLKNKVELYSRIEAFLDKNLAGK